jgi:hypothetical protein
MGIACGDFDGDALPDNFLTHFYNAKSTLYRNLGDLAFLDESRRTKIAALTFHTLGFGTVALDYERDGDLDLALANGHVLGPNITPNEMRPQLLENDGAGRFRDASDEAGPYFQEALLGRGMAGGDFDDDGDLDLAVSHLNRRLALLRNDTPSAHHFVGFLLLPHTRDGAMGGRIVVSTPEGITPPRMWTQPVVAGGSYLSQNDPRLLFGLGEVAGPVRVAVYWPSGKVEEFERVETDRYWVLQEGKPPAAWFGPTD